MKGLRDSYYIRRCNYCDSVLLQIFTQIISTCISLQLNALKPFNLNLESRERVRVIYLHAPLTHVFLF